MLSPSWWRQAGSMRGTAGAHCAGGHGECPWRPCALRWVIRQPPSRPGSHTGQEQGWEQRWGRIHRLPGLPAHREQLLGLAWVSAAQAKRPFALGTNPEFLLPCLFILSLIPDQQKRPPIQQALLALQQFAKVPCKVTHGNKGNCFRVYFKKINQTSI